MSLLVAIDPGLDSVGMAVFVHPKRWASSLDDVILLYKNAHEIRTDPKDELFRRLERISSLVGLELSGPTEAVIEMPAIEGIYGRKKGKGKSIQRGVNRLYMGVGAIMAGIRPNVPTHLVAADTEKKAFRHELLQSAFRHANLTLPEGPRGGKMEDAWDAIWLGCRYLQGQTRDWGG